MPPMIVAPDRDVPGMIPNICAKPTLSASSQVMSSIESMRGGRDLPDEMRCSTHRITSAPTMNAVATGTGLNSAAWIFLMKMRPTMAAGRNATKRLKTKRLAFGSCPSPATTWRIFARYSQHTARIAPAWMMIANDSAFWPVKSSRLSARIR